MWRTVADWLLAVLNMTRELEENRTRLRDLEARVRDIEEAVRLLAQEQLRDPFTLEQTGFKTLLT